MTGAEAQRHTRVVTAIRETLERSGFEEVILPSLWEQETFIEKAGPEIVGQMWSFNDKGGRAVCLIPECTALVQQMWRQEWSKTVKRPYRIFYIQRCYRYERPQAGRYREFTQAGVEILGGQAPEDATIAEASLMECLNALGVTYSYNRAVKRGLNYYVEDGFEAEVRYLGAQKQVAGGGRYAEGIGWAIGVDRVSLALTAVPCKSCGGRGTHLLAVGINKGDHDSTTRPCDACEGTGKVLLET
jgi:histidyl-tRNA synthetase